MFIRIKRRKAVDSLRRRVQKVPANVDLFTLNFVVVQSVRTDKGPRQRVIKHVGSIAEHPLSEREVALFYQYPVERALRQVAATAEPGTYEKLLAQMHRLLPPVEMFLPRMDLEELARNINAIHRSKGS